MITAEALREYFQGEDLQLLLNRLSSGRFNDEISLALEEGLLKVLKEGEPACFTLPQTWRFATRQAAGRSRLPFLEQHIPPGSTIVDASCGIGLMLRELSALKPSVLIGIEIDPVVAEIARANLRLFEIDAEVRVLDAASDEAREILTSADLVFCDPERPARRRERTLEENEPSYDYLSSVAKRLSYEVSPQVPLDELPGVVELYSERRRHARTTIHSGFGPAMRRVVSDRGEVLEGESVDSDPGAFGTGSFLELLDPTVRAAGLSHLLGVWHDVDSKLMRRTDEAREQDFVDRYRILAEGSREGIAQAAQSEEDFGRIALRYPVESDRYWDEANGIRRSGTGDRTLHVFRVDETWLLAESL